MENTKTTLTNLDTGKDRNMLLQKAWRAVSVLVLLALSACGDNLCGCPFGMVCQPAPRQEGFVCVAPPQASDAR